MKLATLVILGILSFSTLAESNQSKLTGGTLKVLDPEGKEIKVSLYEYTNKYELRLSQDLNRDEVSSIEIDNEHAGYDIRLKRKHQYFPLTKSGSNRISKIDVLNGAEKEDVMVLSAILTLPLDLIVTSPIIALKNAIHNRTNEDAICAKNSLIFLKDLTQVNQEKSITSSCLDYLINNLEN